MPRNIVVQFPLSLKRRVERSFFVTTHPASLRKNFRKVHFWVKYYLLCNYKTFREDVYRVTNGKRQCSPFVTFGESVLPARGARQAQRVRIWLKTNSSALWLKAAEQTALHRKPVRFVVVIIHQRSAYGESDREKILFCMAKCSISVDERRKRTQKGPCAGTGP